MVGVGGGRRARQPITVLHVIDTLGLGGAERFLVGLVRELDKERFRPLVAWLSEAGPFADDLIADGIPVVGIGAGGHRDTRALARLVRLMRQEKVCVLNTHLFVDGFYGRLAALWARVPVRVVTQQNAYDDPRLRLPSWQIWANRLLVPTTHRFIAVSQAAREYLHRVEWVPEGKITVIPNAVTLPDPPHPDRVQELRRVWLAGREGPLIGTVARLQPQKGLDVFLRAVRLLRETLPDVRAVIVGEGPLRADLEALAEQLGIADRVVFPGTRRDIPTVLAALDVFVLPSRFEGLSLALLEAMAMARPVVATAVSGTVEVIRDGETGLLVPPEAPDALAARIREMWTHPEQARRMGENARRLIVERYTIQAVARAYEEVYETLLRGGCANA